MPCEYLVLVSNNLILTYCFSHQCLDNKKYIKPVRSLLRLFSQIFFWGPQLNLV